MVVQQMMEGKEGEKRRRCRAGWGEEGKMKEEERRWAGLVAEKERKK